MFTHRVVPLARAVCRTAIARTHSLRSSVVASATRAAGATAAGSATPTTASQWSTAPRLIHNSASALNAGGAAAAGGGDDDAAAATTTAGSHVVEVDEQSFARVVVGANVPVVLDCYADWCGPCRQLTPVLEQMVNAQGGKVLLAKLNTDKNPQLTQALRVTSLPTVFGLSQGKIVDQFVGMKDQAQLNTFFGKLLAAGEVPVEDTPEKLYMQGLEVLDEADSAEDADEAAEKRAAAKQVFTRATELGNTTPDASSSDRMVMAGIYAALVRVALGEGDMEFAKTVADSIRAAYTNELSMPEVSRALAMYDIAAGGGTSDSDGGSSEASAAQAAVDANPDDLDARLKLAQALLSSGRHEEATKECLEIVKRDKEWNEGAGKALLLKTFEALGHTHPVTIAARQKLANLLF